MRIASRINISAQKSWQMSLQSCHHDFKSCVFIQEARSFDSGLSDFVPVFFEIQFISGFAFATPSCQNLPSKDLLKVCISVSMIEWVNR